MYIYIWPLVQPWRLHTHMTPCRREGKLSDDDDDAFPLSSSPPFIIFYRIMTSSVVRIFLASLSTRRQLFQPTFRLKRDASSCWDIAACRRKRKRAGTCVSPYCASCVHLEEEEEEEEDLRWDKSSLAHLSPGPFYPRFYLSYIITSLRI
jgi:hypothetical protein